MATRRGMTLRWTCPERYFIKLLNDDGDSLEEEECLRSSDLDDRSLPTRAKNELPASLIGPKVSTATGMNMWEEERAEYLAVFLFAAALAALPTSVELVDKYDMVKVSTTVANNAKQRLPCHGMRVSPLGRRSEPGIRPDGFLIFGLLLLLLLIILLFFDYYYYCYYYYYLIIILLLFLL